MEKDCKNELIDWSKLKIAQVHPGTGVSGLEGVSEGWKVS